MRFLRKTSVIAKDRLAHRNPQNSSGHLKTSQNIAITLALAVQDNHVVPVSAFAPGIAVWNSAGCQLICGSFTTLLDFGNHAEYDRMARIYLRSLRKEKRQSHGGKNAELRLARLCSLQRKHRLPQAWRPQHEQDETAQRNLAILATIGNSTYSRSHRNPCTAQDQTYYRGE